METVSVRHGHSANGGSREYRSWTGMLARCRNPKDPMFPYYGGKGIKVCHRWLRFDHFLADMGPRPLCTTLERIDNTAGYSPENCRWATQTEQNLNRTITRWFTFGGVTLCLTDWARQLGISKPAMAKRIARWPLERALTAPADSRRR